MGEVVLCWKCGEYGERYPGKRICRKCRRIQDRNKPSVVARRKYDKLGRPPKSINVNINNSWLSMPLMRTTTCNVH